MKYFKGQRICEGKYQLAEPVTDGEGGQATVWKAFSTGPDRSPRAVKLRKPVRKDDAASRNLVEIKAENETVKWANISNKSIYVLNFYESVAEFVTDEQDGVEYIIFGQVCEFAEKGSVGTASKNGDLKKYLNSEEKLIEFFEHTIDAISAAHSESLVHCDIKPDNILLHLEGENNLIPKVGDFGVASALYESLQGFTPAYAPPEVIHENKFSTASDVYSLGLTFLEILYQTLLDSYSDEYRGMNYSTGEQFRRHMKENQDSNTFNVGFDPARYFALFNSMAAVDPIDRPELKEIKSILKKRRREIYGRILAYDSKLKRDTYLWNPNIHAATRKNLYFAFLRGSTPSSDVTYIQKDLARIDFEGFTLSSVSGGWDYMLRFWANPDDEYQMVKEELIRTAANGLMIVDVEETLYATRVPPLPNYRTKKDLIKAIEACSVEPAKEQSALKKKKFIISPLVGNSKDVRVITLISVRYDVHLLQYYCAELKNILLSQKAKNIAVHSVKVKETDHIEAGTKMLMTKFDAKNFDAARVALMTIYGELDKYSRHPGRTFSFSSMFDMKWTNDISSDDGGIFLEIAEQIAADWKPDAN